AGLARDSEARLGRSPPKSPLAGGRQPLPQQLGEGTLFTVDLLHLGRSEVHHVRLSLHPGRILLKAAHLLRPWDDHAPNSTPVPRGVKTAGAGGAFFVNTAS